MVLPPEGYCHENRKVSPVNRGPGKGDFERPLCVGAHRSRPRRRFAYFAAGGKVGRPAGRNPPYKNTNRRTAMAKTMAVQKG